ncbi:unnamed protein product [Rodentolepis nana]|uniref:Fibronectin type-III domain-containing protein n=1 Tax=Rodentolepis nana TaxID=102285 RepID=A0A0R3TU98_RODNA|nr:unnamed protein product [Rodentolepis nana]
MRCHFYLYVTLLVVTTQSQEPLSVQSVQLCQVGKTRARLSYDAVDSPSDCLVGSGYHIQYKDGDSDMEYYFVPTLNETYEFEGKTFDVEVVSKCINPEGIIFLSMPKSMFIQKITEANIATPQNVQLQQIWDKWAHLTWDAVNSPGPQAIHYLVNYTKNGAQWVQLEKTECAAVTVHAKPGSHLLQFSELSF